MVLRKMSVILMMLVLMSCCLSACVLNGETKRSDSSQPPKQSAIEKGSRILGFDISNYGTMNYDEALQKARGTGVQVIDLHFNWSDLEPKEKDYSGLEQYAFLDTYYQDTEVALTIGVIDTNALAVPEYVGSDFSSMKEPFGRLLDKIFQILPNMKIRVLSIGNEVDVYLGTDKEKWKQWSDFYEHAAKYATAKKTEGRKDMIVGTKTTVTGALGKAAEFIKEINNLSATEGILLTYYPLNPDFTVKEPSVASSDINKLDKLFEKKVYILEAGYPSSSKCNSSEEKQAEFVRVMFRSWDQYREKFAMIVFSWLSDLDADQVKNFEMQYGVSDERFLEYLRTIGFMTFDGKDKPAWEQFKKEVKTRKWVK